MPNSRQRSVMASPSRSRATKRSRSSMAEHAFHGINTSRPKAKSVTHVSGTRCHLCLGPLTAPEHDGRVQALRKAPVRKAEPESEPLRAVYVPRSEAVISGQPFQGGGCA